MTRMLPALATLLLAACAADPADQSAATSQTASDMTCTREYPTGTNIPITKCRTREQIETERKVGQDALRQVQKGGPTTSLGGSGN